jgi:hypothetical protein
VTSQSAIQATIITKKKQSKFCQLTSKNVESEVKILLQKKSFKFDRKNFVSTQKNSRNGASTESSFQPTQSV